MWTSSIKVNFFIHVGYTDVESRNVYALNCFFLCKVPGQLVSTIGGRLLGVHTIRASKTAFPSAVKVVIWKLNQVSSYNERKKQKRSNDRQIDDCYRCRMAYYNPHCEKSDDRAMSQVRKEEYANGEVQNSPSEATQRF